MTVIVSEFEVVEDQARASSAPEQGLEEAPLGDEPRGSVHDQLLRALEHYGERASRVAAS